MKSLGIELHLQKSNSAPRIALWQMNKFVEIVRARISESVCVSSKPQILGTGHLLKPFSCLLISSLDLENFLKDPGGLDHIKRIILERIITGLDTKWIKENMRKYCVISSREIRKILLDKYTPLELETKRHRIF